MFGNISDLLLSEVHNTCTSWE